MKKWKFSLEAVRALKNRIEEQAALKHARALTNLNRANAELAETENELNAAALMQLARGKGVPAQELMQLSQYVALLEKKRRERLERSLQAGKEAALARAALEKAAREREILDRLHDRQHAAHQFHVAAHEQKWMDDLAQQVKRGLLAAI